MVEVLLNLLQVEYIRFILGSTGSSFHFYQGIQWNQRNHSILKMDFLSASIDFVEIESKFNKNINQEKWVLRIK